MKKQKKKNLLSAFTKRQLIETYKKPTIAVRLHYIKEAFKDFIHNIKYCQMDEKNIYPLMHIWGNSPNSNLETLDDISIIYNVKENMYYLCIETAFLIPDQEGWGEYLKYTLQEFTKFMEANGLDTDYPKALFMTHPSIELKAETIEELYTNYRLFVNAFCNTYGVEIDEEDYEEEDGDCYI